VHAGQALVGKVHIAERVEHQIVDALEALDAPARAIRGYRARIRVELQNAVLVIRYEDTSVLVYLQTIRLAVVFRDKGPFLVRRYAEDTPEGNIDDVKITVAVE